MRIEGWNAWARRASGVALCLAGLGAAGNMRADPAESQENWDGGGVAGWTNETADVSVANPGGYLDIKFKLQGIPMPSDSRVWVEVPNGVLLTNLMFQFRANTVLPSAVRLVLQSANGHVWHNRVTCTETGVWQVIAVPVAYTNGWTLGPLGGPLDFERDLRHITRMGVYLRRHGVLDEQHYGLDDFTLQGLALSALDQDGDGMRDAWELANQLDPNDPTDADTDADADGMDNYGEYLAGTDPQDPDSRFVLAVDVREGPPPADPEDGVRVEGVVLRWSSVSNRTYAIWRTLDMEGAGLEALESAVPATPPLNAYEDAAATNFDAGYYFIDVQSTE